MAKGRGRQVELVFLPNSHLQLYSWKLKHVCNETCFWATAEVHLGTLGASLIELYQLRMNITRMVLLSECKESAKSLGWSGGAIRFWTLSKKVALEGER